MRPYTSNHEPADRLERLWAATRPEEPSADQLDCLWAEAIARASEPETLPFASARSWGLTLAIFAQAAALLVAAGLGAEASVAEGWAPAAVPSPSVAVVEPSKVTRSDVPAPASLPEFTVLEGAVSIVHLGDGRGAKPQIEHRPQPSASDTDQTGVDVAVLSFMESYE